ncbi:MAG: hypothetical protein Kow0020_00630 [Wenzhouxiangellaceae bacterium]
MPNTRILLFTEAPPPVAHAPATGLAVRHALMHSIWRERGLDVTYAWAQQSPGSPRSAPPDRDMIAMESPRSLARWLAQHRPDLIVLGYWELADWLPDDGDWALVVDHVAPRLLERQFEDRDRLAADAGRLLPVLARADELWVGNARQADLMLGWMLAAGHDLRHTLPVREVPIANLCVKRPRTRPGHPLQILSGGRDWPWRQSARWLAPIRAGAGTQWALLDLSERAAFGTLAAYRDALARADLVVELADDNIERRFSQSFRMTDALCAGVPVLCNDFLPLSEAVEGHGAGWTVREPDELPALLETIAGQPGQWRQRAEGALALGRSRFDAKQVYGDLAPALQSLAGSRTTRRRVPLLPAGAAVPPAASGSGRPFHALRSLCRAALHSVLRRRLRHRPRLTPDRRCWIVVSRPDLFPAQHGAAVRIERTASAVSERIGEVLVLTTRRDGYWRCIRGDWQWQRFPWWLRLAGWPQRLLHLRLAARGVPEHLLYTPMVDSSLLVRLTWLLARYPVELVSGEFPAYARPAVWASRIFGTGSMMVEHNVEFARIAEQYPHTPEQVLGWLKRLEIDLANACDLVVTVSDADRSRLHAAGVAASRMITIPHGVDLETFRSASPVDLRARYRIPSDHALLVYHGIYSYAPNRIAVEELSAAILPALARAGHRATVLAVGPEPPARPLPGVVFTGPVDDLAGHLKGADLAVIPLRSGGGTRMKILDDFAAGVPVISTPKGAEGLPVSDGVQLRLADSPDQIAAAIAELLENPAHARALAGAATQWVAQFDWSTIGQRYVDAVDRRIRR